MILQLPLTNALKIDTIPEPGDTNIVVPPYLLPVAEMSLPFQSMGLATKAGPWVASNVLNTTVAFNFACFHTNAASAVVLCGAIAPGHWRINVDCDVFMEEGAAGTDVTSLSMGFDPAAAIETHPMVTVLTNGTLLNTVRHVNRDFKLIFSRPALYFTVTLPTVGAAETAYCYGSILCSRLA